MKKPTLPPNAKLVFSGILYDVYQWEQEMFDGSTATFEMLKRADTVKIVPILPNGKILLQREKQPNTDWFLDTPTGRSDRGESPLDAAKRELLEETGYEASSWDEWFSYHPDGNIVWEITVYIARELKKAAQPHPDPGEKFEPREVSFDEFLSIPSQPDFRGGQQLASRLIKAKNDEAERKKLEKLFFNKI